MQFTFHIVRLVFFSIRPGWPERRGIYVHVSYHQSRHLGKFNTPYQCCHFAGFNLFCRFLRIWTSFLFYLAVLKKKAVQIR
ncbi:hypothetical protein OUZ56_010821 [Daphnia magna]|uniref:Secreted protein n=1 Tax=Daphnia magna TaxID=35525 RepID=A0ABQ9YYM0_9CRUS|nr:hypothetical protein OUZ56_010821 [Daphnia magna]